MKKLLIICIALLSFNVSAQKTISKGKSDFQKELNEKFANPKTSPLTKKDLKKFKALDFYTIDNTYKVTATFEKDIEEPFVGFPTSTNRIAPYKKYGTLYFTINGKQQQLTVYKSTNSWGDPEKYGNHLFLPFKDTTCKKTSYSGGRFLDLSILDIQPNNTIELDFNMAYNPYCAYSDGYSCPKVPDENILNVAIKAGVKAFKKK